MTGGVGWGGTGIELGRAVSRRYGFPMPPSRATNATPRLWRPHPDDQADIAEAMEAADRGELLSPEASEAFVRWMEGSGDDSWRAELE